MPPGAHSCLQGHRTKARQRPPGLQVRLALLPHFPDERGPPPSRLRVGALPGVLSIPSLPGRLGGGTCPCQRLSTAFYKLQPLLYEISPPCQKRLLRGETPQEEKGGKKTNIVLYTCMPRYLPHLRSPSAVRMRKPRLRKF